MPDSPAFPVELVREFVIAGHHDLPKVKSMLAEQPGLLNAAFPWKEDDHETALQAATQMGNSAMAEFLLSQGAPLELCTAAMLGRSAEVKRMLAADPRSIGTVGAHGIPLLSLAAWSGSVDLVQMLYQAGAKSGASFALFNAASRGHTALVAWLLENASPDLGFKDYQGKTALAAAVERGDEATASLLRKHGAVA